METRMVRGSQMMLPLRPVTTGLVIATIQWV